MPFVERINLLQETKYGQTDRQTEHLQYPLCMCTLRVIMHQIMPFLIAGLSVINPSTLLYIQSNAWILHNDCCFTQDLRLSGEVGLCNVIIDSK